MKRGLLVAAAPAPLTPIYLSIYLYTVRAEIFAVVLFSRISRVKPSRKFPLQFMSIYSNDNISKIAKLTPRELPHLAKTAKIMAYTVSIFLSIHPSFQQLTLVLLVKRGLLVAAAPAPLTPIYLSIFLSIHPSSNN